MLDKKRGYADHRPFYPVDPNASIQSGMVAFLVEDATGSPMVTTAANCASGVINVPIGTFWKDASAQYVRTWGEDVTFDSNNVATFSKGNFHSLAELRVCNTAGTVDYSIGVDFNAVAVNGLLTRLSGSIPASATVTVFATYNVMAGQEWYENTSTQWTNGSTYDRLANDTLGSGKITIVEGIATLFTDQYDVTQTYQLNDTLRSDANSKWTNLPAGAGLSSACGRVVKVNTATDPFLGLVQVRVVA